jgi:hypothetical protein
MAALRRSERQPRIDRTADGITYDPTGPRIEVTATYTKLVVMAT